MCYDLGYMRPLSLLIVLTALLGAGCSAEPSTSLPYGTSTTDFYQSTTSTSSTSPSDSTVPDQKGTSTSPTSMNGSLAFPGVMADAEARKQVKITTSLGDIVVETDPTMGPKAASNFVYLVKQGFYNGTIFHRVIPGFMIQGGDPTGTGMGGPGYKFENDTVTLTDKKDFDLGGGKMNLPYYKDGWLAMANAGRNTNGSQFFIMVSDYPLPPDYSVFGKVVKGLDVAHKIAEVARDDMDRPNTEVKMISVEVVN